MIRDIYVHDNVFQGTSVGLRFKTRRPRGGGGENLYYERNRIKAAKEAISFDMLGAAIYVGGLSARVPMPFDPFTPAYRNIVIRDLIIENASYFLKVNGIPESPARNVTIERIQSHSRRLMLLNDINMLTLRDCRLSADNGDIEVSQARNVYLENVSFEVPEGKVAWKMKEGDNENLFIDGKSLTLP